MIQEDRCSEEKCTTETSDLRLCECCGIHHGVLMYLDWAINILILCPLNVMYWRGLWGLLDIFVVPTHMDISAYISVGLGYAVGFFCYAIQGPLSRYMTDSKKGYFGRFAISRCYTVLFSFGLINEWRGVWQTLDHHFGKSWKSGLTSASVGALVLASTCTLRNILAPPLVMATDHLDDVYASAPTMFNMMKTKKSVVVVIVDIILSVIIVGSLVAFVWRGLWTALDVFLFPDSKVTSMWSSLAIGHGIVLLAYGLQYQMANVSRRLKRNVERIIWEDIFIFVASIGGINVWRGLWMFADVYILPENRVLSNGITSGVGIIGSMLLFAGNTILAKGVYRDGELKDGSGCIFATHYVRKIIEHKLKNRKQRSRKEKTAAIRELESFPVIVKEKKVNGGARKETEDLEAWKIMADGKTIINEHSLEESVELM